MGRNGLHKYLKLLHSWTQGRRLHASVNRKISRLLPSIPSGEEISVASRVLQVEVLRSAARLGNYFLAVRPYPLNKGCRHVTLHCCRLAAITSTSTVRAEKSTGLR